MEPLPAVIVQCGEANSSRGHIRTHKAREPSGNPYRHQTDTVDR